MTTADGSVVGTTKLIDNGSPGLLWDLVIMGDGYRSSELGQFHSDTQDFVDLLFATAPFDVPALASVINVHRVDVISTDSGADDPTACGGTGASARTYFDASFCRNGAPEQRALGIDEKTALTVAGQQVPNWNVVMVIVDSPIYGGGGPVGVFSLGKDRAGNPASAIGLHEMGHTAFLFADEYATPGPPGMGGDHSPPTIVRNNIATTADRDTIGWADLIDTSTALPTTSNPDCSQPDPQRSPVRSDTVGAFEGAAYYHCGAYRAQFNCWMRELGQPFCAVCQRVIHDHLATFNRSVAIVARGFGLADGWHIDSHPRFLVDTTGDGRADSVGFSDDGVFVSRAQPDGTSTNPELVVASFGANAGGWRTQWHPRFMADTTWDRRADIVGFSDDGVFVSRAQPDGTSTNPELVIAGFGSNVGGWLVDRHPRFMADTTGDHRADIVGFAGFADDGVWVARAQPDGTYAAPAFVRAGFGFNTGWRTDRHARFMADTTGDGRADIVGFGENGVIVSRAQPNGKFSPPFLAIKGFGTDPDSNPEGRLRLVADLTPDAVGTVIEFSEYFIFKARNQVR